MVIKMFNFWYFFFIVICIGIVVGLYFILHKCKPKTQKIVLFSILILGVLVHFLKVFIPPYSTDHARMLRDSWFINICGANIALFPFFFISKSNRAKDYMFYLGMLGGLISLFYPMEPMLKVNQAAEWLDIVRFYFHHTMLWGVPLLMVLLKLHKLDYKRVIFCPVYLLGVMLFIMLNQVLQSELGFIPMRGDDIFAITYKNSSLIWGPSGSIGDFIGIFCPSFFKTIPYGPNAGQAKYWPWFWLIVPIFLFVTPISFLMCMIFDYKHFKEDMIKLINFLKSKTKKKNKSDCVQDGK